MDEPDVVVSFCEFLDEKGHTFFVDSTYGPEKIDELPQRLENCELNSTIRINRRIPDIIGFTPDEEIFAVEVKGEDDIRKGIGQAAYYRQGVHKSYLVADDESLAEFEETALSCGIGTYRVSEQEISEPNEPNQNVAATQLNKTRRSLAVRTSGFEVQGGGFSSITMPANALLPVIYLSREETPDEAEGSDYRDWVDAHEDGLNSSTARHTLSLSDTLQLIESTRNGLALTETGKSGYLILRGLIETVPPHSFGLDQNQTVKSVTDRMMKLLNHARKAGRRRTKLHQDYPQIATFLRGQYLSIPDVRMLTKVLSQLSGTEADLAEVMSRFAAEAPDTFLNLFVRSSEIHTFEEVMRNSDIDVESAEFTDFILDIASPDYLYNFTYQLWHAGILREGTEPVHQSTDKVERGEFSWAWDKDLIGDFGLDRL